jgi:predicted nucleic-acid-binding protein
MLAVDTNLVIRYLTGDDPRQFELAVAAIEQADAYVCLTVLLEAEWVLRSVYRYRPEQVVRAFRGLAGLPRVTIEEPAVADLALEWAEGGLDFADALHLAKVQSCEAFLSFDADLVQRAGALGSIPVRSPEPARSTR